MEFRLKVAVVMNSINQVLDELWRAALNACAEDFVRRDGTVGRPEEETYLTLKDMAFYKARTQLERGYIGQELAEKLEAFLDRQDLGR